MTIERLDLGQQLPRLDRKKLQDSLRDGMGGVLDEIVGRWNEAMREIEDKINEQLGQKINFILDTVNTDVAYWGTRDQYGQWENGSWKMAYDSTSGAVQLSRLESGAWVLKLTFATDGQINAVDLALSSPEDVYDLDHDSFTGFVEEEHIDHSDVSITAGDGLSGGGTIEATRTLTNSDKGSTAVSTHQSTYDHSLLHSPATVADTTSIDLTITGQQISGAVLPAGVDHDGLANFVAAEHIDWSATGAEDVHKDRIAADAVTQHEGSINHDNLSGFIANEHIDWTADQGATNIHTGNLGGVSGTLVLDDGTTERITLVFTNGLLTSRTIAAASGLLMNWTD